jgi:hypothetical protein
MLWSTSAPTAVNVSSSGYAVSSEPGRVTNRHYVRDGLLAEWVWLDAQMVQQVRVIRLSDGQVLWTRRVDARQVDGLWIVDGRVVIALDQMRRIMVCAGQTGQVLSSFEPGPADSLAFAAWNDSRIALVSNGALTMVDYTGRQTGRIVVRGPRRLDRVSEQWLGMVEADQSLSLVNLDEGRVAWRLDADQVGVNGYDLALTPDHKRLYYLSQNSRRQMGLAIIDVEAGEVVRWVDVPRRMAIRMPAETLAQAGPIVPFFESDQRDRRRAHARFFDVRTGRPVDDLALPLPHGQKTLKHLAAPPVIRHGVMLIPTAEYVYAIGNPAGDFTAPQPAAQPEQSQDDSVPDADAANAPTGSAAGTPARLIIRDGELRIEGQPPIRGRIILNGREFRVVDGQLVPAVPQPGGEP